jgi:hypothetical protein
MTPSIQLRKDGLRRRQLLNWRKKYPLTDEEQRELEGISRRIKWLSEQCQVVEVRL